MSVFIFEKKIEDRFLRDSIFPFSAIVCNFTSYLLFFLREEQRKPQQIPHLCWLLSLVISVLELQTEVNIFAKREILNTS